MKRTEAEIVREYGPIPGGDDGVRWVSFDGRRIWFGAGDRLNSPDPESGKLRGALEIASHARTAFDGRRPLPIAGTSIRKIDPDTGKVFVTIPAAGSGEGSGLAFDDETPLWRPATCPLRPDPGRPALPTPPDGTNGSHGSSVAEQR